MRRVVEGDEAAFCSLMGSYGPALFRFAARQLGDVDLAQNAVQETFVRLWRSRAGYKHCGKLSAYLYRVTRNICLDIREWSGTVVALDSAAENRSPAVDRSVDAVVLGEDVRAALVSLPDEQRLVVSLSCNGLSYAEIAEIVGCPVGTVASRKRLAVQALRAKLAAWED